MPEWLLILTSAQVTTFSPGVCKTVGPLWDGQDNVGMVLQLAPEKPEAGPWHTELLTVVADSLIQLGSTRTAGDRAVVLAVDGRSSSGKTMVAARLQETVAGSAVVHTDDIAWWHSRFGWADLLIEGVLMPVHRGQPVDFRPPA